jgi:hypothetical protein
MSLKRWIALVVLIVSAYCYFWERFIPHNISGFVLFFSLFLLLGLGETAMEELSLFVCFAATVRYLQLTSSAICLEENAGGYAGAGILSLITVAVNFWSYGVMQGTKKHTHEDEEPNYGEEKSFFGFSFIFGLVLLICSFFKGGGL